MTPCRCRVCEVCRLRIEPTWKWAASTCDNRRRRRRSRSHPEGQEVGECHVIVA